VSRLAGAAQESLRGKTETSSIEMRARAFQRVVKGAQRRKGGIHGKRPNASVPHPALDMRSIQLNPMKTTIVVRMVSIASVPCSFNWNGVPAGTHTMRAVATDGNGRIGISDPITFTVQ
jgi:hypothetical protein